MFSDDEDAADLVSAWLEKKKYKKVLRLWANGFDTDWEQLYTDSKPRRISLPSYPFRADRYWVPKRSSCRFRIKNSIIAENMGALRGSVFIRAIQQNSAHRL